MGFLRMAEKAKHPTRSFHPPIMFIAKFIAVVAVVAQGVFAVPVASFTVVATPTAAFTGSIVTDVELIDLCVTPATVADTSGVLALNRDHLEHQYRNYQQHHINSTMSTTPRDPC
ncbi:hypothetical protein B0T22DRAFT_445003 [Podospora appendiculata]|uniref:Uncharacterized protein n=1 Tax=Podospora appendiculata TaxID=314037 RepID=A0AAE0X1S0_9PEZI|nr:hypothetical protein B0T22DRAFT_445003 [Podospora appendiculata]